MNGQGLRLVLQVGTEIRIKNNGDVVVDNPELELDRDVAAADAVLLYNFDEKTGEHRIRLVEPVADHRHMKSHRPND